jgi:hypothetical protein
LGVNRDLSAVDGSKSSYYGVTVGAINVHAKSIGAMTNKLVYLNKRALIQKDVDSFPSSLFPLSVLFLYSGITIGVDRLVVAVSKVIDFAGSGGKVCL